LKQLQFKKRSTGNVNSPEFAMCQYINAADDAPCVRLKKNKSQVQKQLPDYVKMLGKDVFRFFLKHNGDSSHCNKFKAN